MNSISLIPPVEVDIETAFSFDVPVYLLLRQRTSSASRIEISGR